MHLLLPHSLRDLTLYVFYFIQSLKMCCSFEYVQLCCVHIWRCICQIYIPFHSWPDATSYSLKGSNFILIRDELQVWLKCTKILEGYFVSLFFQPYISNTKYLYQKSGGSKVSKNNVVFTVECMSCFMALLLANYAKFSYLQIKPSLR